MSAYPPANPWENVAYISPSRLTRMTHLALPGTTLTGGINTSISNLNPIMPTMMVTCTQTGGGFVKDQTYIRNSDNTAWIGMSGGVHLHDDVTESSGGLLSDILMANQGKAFFYHDLAPISSNYKLEGTVGLSPTDDVSTGALTMAVTTSTNYMHLSRSGVKLSFGKPSQFMFKGHVTYTGSGNVTAHIGMGLGSVVSENNALQYGLRVCDSAGLEKQWELIQGNGTTKGTTTTTEMANQGNPRGYRIKYTPGSGSQFWVNGVLNQTCTSEVVTSGSSSGIRTVSMGIKANVSATRTMKIYGVSLAGTIGDNSWTA